MNEHNLKILKKIEGAVRQVFPINPQGHEKRIEFLGFEIPDDFGYDRADFLESVRTKEDYTVPIYAKLKYQGMERRVPIIDYPVVTPDTSEVCIGGNTYTSVNLLTQREGVYFREATEDSYENHFVVSGGKNFKIMFEPDSRKLFFKIKQANIPVVPVLLAMGFTAGEIKDKIGQDVYGSNLKYKGEPGEHYDNLIELLGINDEENGKAPNSKLQTLKLDPETTKINMDKEHDKVTPKLVLEAVGKLVALYKGDFKPVSKDAPVFKGVKKEDSFIARTLFKDAGRIRREIKKNSEKFDKLDEIVDKSLFNKPVFGFWNSTKNSELGVKMNLVSVETQKRKITPIGEGGIGDEGLVSLESRGVQFGNIGFIDEVVTPESSKTGLTRYIANGVEVKDNLMYQTFYNVKEKKHEKLSNYDTFFKKIGFPENWDKENKRIKANGEATVPVIYKNDMIQVKPNEVDYVLDDAQKAFTSIANLSPAIQSTNGNRLGMVGRQLSQAIPLKNPEKPLFFSGEEKVVGSEYLIKAKNSGKVEVKNDSVHVGGVLHKIPKATEFGEKSLLKYKIIVKTGDTVKKGDILANTNFHNEDELAMGLNVVTAIMPWKGLNIEDATVISESLAKRFTSEHSHKLELELGENVELSKEKYKNLFPLQMTQENYAKLDEEGVVKEGQTLRQGDVAIAGVLKKVNSEEEKALMRLGRVVGSQLKDAGVIYDIKYPAKVISVIKKEALVSVVVEYEKKLVEGDKITGRYGNKMIVGTILPDNEMPKTKEGKSIELLFNPIGVPSRINPSQLIELSLSKAGKRVNGKGFETNDLELAKKVKTRETLETEEFGDIEEVPVGSEYFYKLMHVVDKKISARSNDGYTSDNIPTKGKQKGGQSLGYGEYYALMSHGLDNFIEETATQKAENNPELWDAISEGRTLPKPKEKFTYTKFNSILKSMGINVEEVGGVVNYYPVTEKQVDELSNLEVKGSGLLKGEDNSPEKDGLLSLELGGTKGERWGKITLKTPVINPLFKENVRIVLDEEKEIIEKMKKQELYDKLKAIDVDEEIQRINQEKKKGVPKSTRDKYNKKLKLLYGLKKADVGAENYMMTKLPVLPPTYRPVVVDEVKGNVIAHSFNELYRDVVEMNNTVKDKTVVTKADEKRMQKVVDGLFEGKTSDAGKKVTGLKGYIAGTNPKSGYFQSKVIKNRQDYSGRSTIIPGPNLKPDEVVLPYDISKKIFEPFIYKEMRDLGYKKDEIDEMVKRKDPRAINAMQEVMKEKRVLLNRAPSLHKFSILGFKPVLGVEDKGIKVPSLHLKSFNADFDGDTMSIHVAVNKESIKEIDEKAMANKNVFNEAYDKRIQPAVQDEQILGIYSLTRPMDEKIKTIDIPTIEMAAKYWEDNPRRFKPEQPVKISMENKGNPVSFGLALMNAKLPRQYRVWTYNWRKKEINGILRRVGVSMKPEDLTELIDEWKNLGNWYATKYPRGLAVDDLIDVRKEKKELMTNLYKEIEGKSEKEKLKKIMETADEINKTILDKAVEKNNTFAHLSHTGAKGNESQTRQILGMPGMFLNIKGQISGQPVISSFGEGLSLSEYVSTLPASRLGTYARANSTARPGYLGKLMTSSALEEEITERDCNTTKGKEYKIGEKGAVNRVLAVSIGGYPKDTPVSEELMAELEKKGHKSIKVRSPLTCESEGLCQKCYGVNSYGKFEDVGMRVGIQVTQALSETGTQAAMNLFHTGGVATKTHLENTTSDLPSGIDLIEQTLFMPSKRRGEAIICEIDGMIEEIKKNSLGENFVVVKSGNKKKEYRIPVGREIKVKKGQSIKKGDLITDGLRNAHKLMELSDKNLFQFRNELNDDIKSSFNSDQSDRTFEVFTRALTNMAVVTNDGGNVGLVEGDVVSLSKLEKMNNQGIKEIQTSGIAVGEVLAERIVKANFEKGRKLTKGDVERLKYLGVGKVRVKAEKVEFEPFLKGINQLALYKNDPMTRMSFNRIDSTLKNMASHGDFSDTDSNTISSLAKGVGFGKKKRDANEWK